MVPVIDETASDEGCETHDDGEDGEELDEVTDLLLQVGLVACFLLGGQGGDVLE